MRARAEGSIEKGLGFLFFAGMLVVAGGCSHGSRVVVSRYPTFWSETDHPRTLALAPLSYASAAPASTQVVGEKLATTLIRNGTYRVLARGGQARDAAQALAQEQALREADTLLTGTITTYAAATKHETRYENSPVYAFDRHGRPVLDANGNQVVRRYDQVPYDFTRHDATVEAVVTLTRVSDGATLYSTTVRGTWWSQGSSPPLGREECLANAVDEMVGLLVGEIAPVGVRISVNKRSLRTATELYDAKWTFSEEFAPDAKELIAVVRLPKEAGKNQFHLVIVREGERKELATKDFTWDGSYQEYGYSFSPAEIVSQAGGTGDFTIKLYSGTTPVATYDFSIE